MSELGKSTPSAAGDSCIVDAPIKNDVKLDAATKSEDEKTTPLSKDDITTPATDNVIPTIPENNIEVKEQILDNKIMLCNAAGEPCVAGTLQSVENHFTKEEKITSIENVDLKVCALDKEEAIISKNNETISDVQEEKKQIENVEAKVAEENTNGKINDLNSVSRLEQELETRTEERDSYQKKLEETEKRLSDLQVSYDAITSGDSDEATLRRSMEQLRTKLKQTTLQLEDRGRMVVSQENQINALNNQVTSLKEVVAITRDLLQIRNMEVKHLQHEIDDMETRISEEHERHNTMLNKMDAAVRLNADLKKEYETQLGLFQDLRGKYEEKVNLLSAEKEALESAAQAAAK